MNQYDKQHKRNLTQYEKQIGTAMEQSQQWVSLQIAQFVTNLSPDKPFRWEDHPVAKQRMEVQAKQLAQTLQQTIENGITQEWALSNQKNDHFTQSAFGEYLQQLPEEKRQQYLNNNQEALEAFKQRKVQGLGLSSRVWNITREYKEEVEMAIDTAVRDGLPATQLATRLKQYLHNPDALFRRVRNRWGELELSKHARAYHPGQGVYRSAYKNARRTASTEINIAYRTSDYDRWQQMDFVVGIEIEPSRTNHPDHDLCDTLAGKYPKAFKFTGWHPHCRCIATPILKTKQEMQRDTERIMQGGEPEQGSKNTVHGVPKNYEQWVEDNQQCIEKHKTLPYFLTDNKKFLNQTIEKHGREATKQARQALAKHTEKHNYTEAQQENFKAIEQATGYLRGAPMTFEQADNGRSNQSKDKDNCAACVLTHELRLRGFNITAKPYCNKTNSISEQLSADTRLAWLTAKNTKPKYTALIAGAEKEITSKINKLTATIGSRYNISWDINKQIGHIVTMERTEQGLIIYDPQKDTFLSIGEIINEMMPQTALQLLRVDTLLVNVPLIHHLTSLLK